MNNVMPNGANAPYRIVNLQSAKEALTTLMARARAQGVDEKVANAIQANWARLRNNPVEFGEACYDLSGLQLQVRIAAHRSLGVRFAVDQTNRIVYVMDVYAMTDLGLK
jgi:hypothetical protein